MLPNSTERSVMVSGTNGAVMHCIQRLCAIIAEVKARSMCECMWECVHMYVGIGLFYDF